MRQRRSLALAACGLVLILGACEPSGKKPDKAAPPQGPAATAAMTPLAAMSPSRPAAWSTPRRTPPGAFSGDRPATVLPATILPKSADAILAGRGLLTLPSSYSGRVHVQQKGTVRYLFLGRHRRVIQTRLDMRQPTELVSPYLKCLLMALTWYVDVPKELRRVLMIGLGGGAWTRYFKARMPGIAFHSVELDPTVVAVARRYFGVKDEGGYRSYVQDGRKFLKEARRPYDLIVVDAFNADADVPRALVSKEFFELLKGRLTRHGVLAMNFIIKNRTVYRRLAKTVDAVFPIVRRLPLKDGFKVGNVVLFASPYPERTPTREQDKKRLARLARTLRIQIPYERCMKSYEIGEKLQLEYVQIFGDR